MPSATSAESLRLGDVREPLSSSDEDAAEEFSGRLGIGQTPATEPQERASLTSLPPEIQQQILSHAENSETPAQSFLNVRSLRLTGRSLEEAFLGDPGLRTQYTSNWKKDRVNIAIHDIENEGGKAVGAPEADDIIARHDVTNIIDQGKIRTAGARRDVEGFLPADSAISRHQIFNPHKQHEVRLHGAKFDVNKGRRTSTDAILRQGIQKQEDKDELLRARVNLTRGIKKGREEINPPEVPGLSEQEIQAVKNLVSREQNKGTSIDDIRRSLGVRLRDLEELVPSLKSNSDYLSDSD